VTGVAAHAKQARKPNSHEIRSTCTERSDSSIQNPRHLPGPRVDAHRSSEVHRATMVYISSWQQYQEAAENLYASSPRKVRVRRISPHRHDANEQLVTDYWEKTRYSVKWKSSEGKLVLKITDDVTVRNTSPSSFGVEHKKNNQTVSEIQNSFFHFPWSLRGTQSIAHPENDE
jgi:hypothetical protein